MYTETKRSIPGRRNIKTKMKQQIKTLVKLFKGTWLFVLIAALIGTLVLHLLPMVVKNFMDKF